MKLTKKKARSLPRVTAYATARWEWFTPVSYIRFMNSHCSSSYRMNELMKFFNARRNAYHTSPKLIDDVIYTPYVYEIQSKNSDSRHVGSIPLGDLLGISELRQETPEDDDKTVRRRRKRINFFNAATHEAEIFMFQYGTVVIWGMTETQEKRFLASMFVFAFHSYLLVRR